MSDHHLSPGELLAASTLAASLGGHISQAFAGVPGWVGGAVAGLVVGVVLRLLDPAVIVGVVVWVLHTINPIPMLRGSAG